ncbi:MAG TPA: hypothetical protein VGP93_15380 [Polyangiaceae bacterium]|jgi:hypothetical protein|nr:hypothetical protein [Polyangiaceae bacterium]
MKRPTLVLGEDQPEQRNVSAIPPSHTKVSEKKAEPSASDPPLAPPRPDGGQGRVQAALAASNRTEASLSQLLRAVQSLNEGVSGAREANVQLVSELEKLREMLGTSNEQQLGLRNRVTALEKELEQAREVSARERVFLTEQHDSFITSLIEDHEAAVAELKAELEQVQKRAEQPRTDPDPSPRGTDKVVAERERTRETLLKLQTQRDEAQAAVARITRERDLVLAELAQMRIQQGMSEAMRDGGSSPTASKPASSPTASSRPLVPALSSLKASSPAGSATPSSRPPRAVKPTSNRPSASPPASSNRSGPPLSSLRSTAPMGVNRPPSSRPTAPPLDFKTPSRPSPPPSELAAALTPPVLGQVSPPPASEQPTSSAPMKPKPDPSTRPLVGYSLTDSSEERVDTSRLTNPTRPPQR